MLRKKINEEHDLLNMLDEREELLKEIDDIKEEHSEIFDHIAKIEKELSKSEKRIKTLARKNDKDIEGRYFNITLSHKKKVSFDTARVPLVVYKMYPEIFDISRTKVEKLSEDGEIDQTYLDMLYKAVVEIPMTTAVSIKRKK